MERFILKTHENSEGSIFTDLEDEEFKETIQNARKKLETSVDIAMPCKIKEGLWEWVSKIFFKNKTFVYSRN